MGFILNKLEIEDYLGRQMIYSKNIRGKLKFQVETHCLDGGKHLQIFLYRAHPRTQEFLEVALGKGYLTTQTKKIELEETILRLYINDEAYMINANGKTDIDILEQNFNTKEITIQDFEKGKAAILINIYFEKETDNAKVQKELKDSNMEEQNERTNITSN